MYEDYVFVLEDEKFICEGVVEKMSKSKYNTVNPDDIIQQYGADCFRMYEMFLGPLELSKPWDTKGIEGVYRFIRKLWRLFFDESKGNQFRIIHKAPTEAELKVIHQTIKKVEQDIERSSLNTPISHLMIAVNELTDLNCHNKEILTSLLIILSPFAPFLTEELWNILGNNGNIINAQWPKYDENILKESSKVYPISINGKLRAKHEFSLDISQKEVESIVMNLEVVQKWLEGKTPKKIIYVKERMINIVV